METLKIQWLLMIDGGDDMIAEGEFEVPVTESWTREKEINAFRDGVCKALGWDVEKVILGNDGSDTTVTPDWLHANKIAEIPQIFAIVGPIDNY